VVLNVDFNSLLSQMGVSGTLDPNSVRVVRDNGALATTQQFTDTVFNDATDAVGNGWGEVRFLMQRNGPGPSTSISIFWKTAPSRPGRSIRP
jgi:hypothetical protein